ncbi:c-type cytochrome [Azonexus sp. IMCC34842]|uniref:c-type cytochrome n=1 Tax=Azonexus sp. IMCC34842 TaxID=3420950 RepID=UPI003D11C27E
MPCRRLFIVALIPLLLTACSEPEDTGPGQPVTHRRTAFNTILKAFEPMGSQLRKSQYKADDFITLAKRLNQAKQGPWEYFTPGSDYPPSRATGAVWSEAEKFEARRQDFFKAADQLLVAAETRDEAKAKAAYEVLHDTCRECHKTFKKS